MEAESQAVNHVAIDDAYHDHDARFADDSGDLHDWLDRQDSLEAVADAIATLNEKEQRVLQLYFNEELNLAEIGRILGVTPGRVCQIKASALAAVKRAVEGAA
jgi:RNA polymerase sigma factor FliA